MIHTVYYYGSEEELRQFTNKIKYLFNVKVTRTTNSWKVQLESKSLEDSVNSLSINQQEMLFNYYRPKFETKKGRHKIILPSKEDLELERKLNSVAELARKYKCSPATINRRLGLIKK